MTGSELSPGDFRVSEDWQDQPLPTLGHLAIFLGGSADSFTGQLLALFLKADVLNYPRLARAFPTEARALQAWQRIQPAPTWRELDEYLRRPLPCDGSDL